MSAIEQLRAIEARKSQNSEIFMKSLVPPPEPKEVEPSFCHSSDELEKYRRSDRWQELRQARLEFDGYRCIMCNRVATYVHHVRYPEALGMESVEDDLRSTCQGCHLSHHKCPGLDEYRKPMIEEGWERCPLCKQKIRKLNPHRMDISKVEFLRDISHLNASGIEWVKVQQDSALVPKEEEEKNRTLQRDAVHATRLKWFELLELKEPRSGEYKVTQKGVDFLLGKESVPAVIYCKDGNVVEESSECVFLKDVKGVVLDKDYWDNYAEVQVTPTEARGEIGHGSKTNTH